MSKILIVTGVKGSEEYNKIVFEEFRKHGMKVTTIGYPKYLFYKFLNKIGLKKFDTSSYSEIHGHSMGSIVTQIFEESQLKVKIHGMVDFGVENEQYNSFVEGHRGSKYDLIADEVHQELVGNENNINTEL